MVGGNTTWGTQDMFDNNQEELIKNNNKEERDFFFFQTPRWNWGESF